MIMPDCIDITGFKKRTCTDTGSVLALMKPQVIAQTASTSIKQVGSAECTGIRGDNASTRSIQKAILEPLRRGYKLRFTEINQGKLIETVWELDQRLIIESAKTGTAPEGQWNLTSYNRQPPVSISPTGKFSISMMVSSRSVCTFAGTLQFLSNAQSNLFPAPSPPSQQPPKAAPTASLKKNDVLGWRGARWGMTEADIVKIFGPSLNQVPKREDFSNFYVKYVIRDLEIGEENYTVRFQMDYQNNRLMQILIRPDQINEIGSSFQDRRKNSFFGLEKSIRQEIGPPTSKEDKEDEKGRFYGTRKWVFPTSTIELRYTREFNFSSGFVALSYYPTPRKG
jgi:hypothetical protein